MEWNIGGAIFADGTEDLQKVASTIDQHSPDVVVLFESHSSPNGSQSQLLATMLGYPYFIEDPISNSHLSDGRMLGHGILSRYPLSDHALKVFKNPNLRTTWHDADITTHDKGVTSVKLMVDSHEIFIQTLHAIPFIPFKVTIGSTTMASIIADMEKNINYISTPSIIVGDFNLDVDSIINLFPHLASNGFKEIDTSGSTTINGLKLDRILYKDLTPYNSRVIQLENSDHYPVISTFETS